MDEVAELLKTWKLPDLFSKYAGDQHPSLISVDPRRRQGHYLSLKQGEGCWRVESRQTAEFVCIKDNSLPNLDLLDSEFERDPANVCIVEEEENVPTSNIANFIILEENVLMISAKV